jgi:protein SCO1
MASSEGMTVCRLCRSRTVFAAIMFLLLGSCKVRTQAPDNTLPFYNTAAFDAEWIAEDDEAYSRIHTIDTFSLWDQSGHMITSDSLKGKIYIANFFFSTCPSICPKMVSNLKILQDSFKNDESVKLLSFSVTPWKDSISRLREYGRNNDIDPHQWHLLTGSKERIYTLARQSYFAEKSLGIQKDTSEFLHTETMLLVDGRGRIRGIYNATQKVDVQRVTEDIYILKKEG